MQYYSFRCCWPFQIPAPSAANKRGGKLLSGPDRVTFVKATIIYSTRPSLVDSTLMHINKVNAPKRSKMLKHDYLGVVGWKVWRVSNCATTCNKVCKQTQHITSNNVGSCWATMLRLFARSLILKQIDFYGKVCLHIALWYSLFARSLILKQIDLYGKAIITQECITHRRNFIINDIIFWAIGVKITWQWRHQPLSTWTLECFTLCILWVLVFRYAKFHRNLWEEFRDILIFLKKRVFLKKGLVALSNLSKIWLCCRGGGSNQAR